jgi:hypothetical protein
MCQELLEGSSEESPTGHAHKLPTSLGTQNSWAVTGMEAQVGAFKEDGITFTRTDDLGRHLFWLRFLLLLRLKLTVQVACPL